MMCPRCNKDKQAEDFYDFSRAKSLFCKDCCRKIYSYEDLCKAADVPYVEEFFDFLKKTRGSKDKSIFDLYLKHMELPAYKSYHYEDSQKLNELTRNHY